MKYLLPLLLISCIGCANIDDETTSDMVNRMPSDPTSIESTGGMGTGGAVSTSSTGGSFATGGFVSVATGGRNTGGSNTGGVSTGGKMPIPECWQTTHSLEPCEPTKDCICAMKGEYWYCDNKGYWGVTIKNYTWVRQSCIDLGLPH